MVEGLIYATHDMCTHEDASLADGFIDGECIECPLHQAMFHIPTGAIRSLPATKALRIYPVRVTGGDVHVRATPSETPHIA